MISSFVEPRRDRVPGVVHAGDAEDLRIVGRIHGSARTNNLSGYIDRAPVSPVLQRTIALFLRLDLRTNIPGEAVANNLLFPWPSNREQHPTAGIQGQE